MFSILKEHKLSKKGHTRFRKDRNGFGRAGTVLEGQERFWKGRNGFGRAKTVLEGQVGLGRTRTVLEGQVGLGRNGLERALNNPVAL